MGKPLRIVRVLAGEAMAPGDTVNIFSNRNVKIIRDYR